MLKVGETRDTKVIMLRKDQVQPLPTKRARAGTGAGIQAKDQLFPMRGTRLGT